MSKTISIINAANVYARNFLRTVKGFDRVHCSDIYNFSHNERVKNLNSSNDALLEDTIAEAETVVHFTHDYYANVTDKNEQLIKTAKFCEKHGVKKLITVSPLEFVNYYNPTGAEDPVLVENRAIDEAQSDLNYGNKSFLVRFIKQGYSMNYEFTDFEQCRYHRYKPVHFKELRDRISTLVEEDCSTLYGKKYLVQGTADLSLAELARLLQQGYEDKNHTTMRASPLIYGAAKSAGLFLYGNNHRINIELMLKAMKHDQFSEEGFESLASATNMASQSDVLQFYTHKKENEAVNGRIFSEHDTLEYPMINRYWRATLD